MATVPSNRLHGAIPVGSPRTPVVGHGGEDLIKYCAIIFRTAESVQWVQNLCRCVARVVNIKLFIKLIVIISRTCAGLYLHDLVEKACTKHVT